MYHLLSQESTQFTNLNHGLPHKKAQGRILEPVIFCSAHLLILCHVIMSTLFIPLADATSTWTESLFRSLSVGFQEEPHFHKTETELGSGLF